LQPDGTYQLPVRPAGVDSFRAQKYFMAAASLRGSLVGSSLIPVMAPLEPKVSAL